MSRPSYFKEDYKNEIYERYIQVEDFLPEFRSRAQDFLCDLCGGVYYKPVQTKEGQVYCESCFLNAIKDAKLAKEKLKPVKTNINGVLRDFSVGCPNGKIGCDWSGTYGDLEAHLTDVCTLQMLECKNSQCDKLLSREEVNAHDISCEHKQMLCPYCYFQVTMGTLSQHYALCPRFKVPCLKCREEVERCNLITHMEDTCSAVKVLCRFNNLGCDFSSDRKAVALHMENNLNSNSHLNLLLDAFSLMDKDHQEFKNVVNLIYAKVCYIEEYLQSKDRKFRPVDEYEEEEEIEENNPKLPKLPKQLKQPKQIELSTIKNKKEVLINNNLEKKTKSSKSLTKKEKEKEPLVKNNVNIIKNIASSTNPSSKALDKENMNLDCYSEIVIDSEITYTDHKDSDNKDYNSSEYKSDEELEVESKGKRSQSKTKTANPTPVVQEPKKKRGRKPKPKENPQSPQIQKAQKAQKENLNENPQSPQSPQIQKAQKENLNENPLSPQSQAQNLKESDIEMIMSCMSDASNSNLTPNTKRKRGRPRKTNISEDKEDKESPVPVPIPVAGQNRMAKSINVCNNIAKRQNNKNKRRSNGPQSDDDDFDMKELNLYEEEDDVIVISDDMDLELDESEEEKEEEKSKKNRKNKTMKNEKASKKEKDKTTPKVSKTDNADSSKKTIASKTPKKIFSASCFQTYKDEKKLTKKRNRDAEEEEEKLIASLQKQPEAVPTITASPSQILSTTTTATLPVPLNEPCSKQSIDVLNISKGLLAKDNLVSCITSFKNEHLFAFSNYRLDPNASSSWRLKFMDYTHGWIAVGACIKESVMANKYKFVTPNRDFNHSCFLVSSNNYSWNAVESSENNKEIVNMPKYKKGTEIVINFDHIKKTLSFYIGDFSTVLSNVDPKPSEGLNIVPCAVFLNAGDALQFEFSE